MLASPSLILTNPCELVLFVHLVDTQLGPNTWWLGSLFRRVCLDVSPDRFVQMARPPDAGGGSQCTTWQRCGHAIHLSIDSASQVLLGSKVKWCSSNTPKHQDSCVLTFLISLIKGLGRTDELANQPSQRNSMELCVDIARTLFSNFMVTYFPKANKTTASRTRLLVLLLNRA